MNHNDHTPETPQPLPPKPHDPVADYLDFIDEISTDVDQIPEQKIDERARQLFGEPQLLEGIAFPGSAREQEGILLDQARHWDPDCGFESITRVNGFPTVMPLASDAVEIIIAAHHEAHRIRSRIRDEALDEAADIRAQAEREACERKDAALSQAASIVGDARDEASAEAARIMADAHRIAQDMISAAQQAAEEIRLQSTEVAANARLAWRGPAAQTAVALRDGRIVVYRLPWLEQGQENGQPSIAVSGLSPAQSLAALCTALPRFAEHDFPLIASQNTLDLPILVSPFAVPAASRAPVTDRESALCSLFVELLGVPTASVNDDFFQLGGDSLTMVRLTERARAAGMEFTPYDVLVARTPAALAALTDDVRRASTGPSTDLAVDVRPADRDHERVLWVVTVLHEWLHGHFELRGLTLTVPGAACTPEHATGVDTAPHQASGWDQVVGEQPRTWRARSLEATFVGDDRIDLVPAVPSVPANESPRQGEPTLVHRVSLLNGCSLAPPGTSSEATTVEPGHVLVIAKADAEPVDLRATSMETEPASRPRSVLRASSLLTRPVTLKLAEEFLTVSMDAIDRCVSDVATSAQWLGISTTPEIVERIAREHLLALVTSSPSPSSLR